jgi:hypothetical protein
MKEIWKHLVSSDPRFFSSWRILARKQKPGEKPPSRQHGDFLPLSESAHIDRRLSPLLAEEVIPHPLVRMMGYLGNRRIWIWGAGAGGGKLLALLKQAGIPIFGFIDSDPRKCGTRFFDLPIRNPEAIKMEKSNDSYIFIGSIHSAEIERQLEEWGYRYWIDFLTLNPA